MENGGQRWRICAAIRVSSTLLRMMTFEQRLAFGEAHEQHVAEELTLRGWEVSRWGQGILGPQTRQALRHTDGSFRWQPDLVAARDDIVVMIDCKCRMTSKATDRHAVERAAVKAHRLLIAADDLPLYYVFDDLGVLTPDDVLAAGRLGPHTRLGSGAPYYLVSTTVARPFDDLFGVREQRVILRAVA